MYSPKSFLRSLFLAMVCLCNVGMAFAAGAHYKTPEEAITAYINGVARHDFDAVMSTTSIDQESKNLDFTAFVLRLGTFAPAVNMPSSDPFFVAVNKSLGQAILARQIQFLVYGLMTQNDVIHGLMVRMTAEQLNDFINVVQARRLEGLKIVKFGIPNPEMFNSVNTQANWARIAKIYAADAHTERLVLLSFEGLYFIAGFALNRYGDNWAISSQTSGLAGGGRDGIPQRVTPDEFERVLRWDCRGLQIWACKE